MQYCVLDVDNNDLRASCPSSHTCNIWSLNSKWSFLSFAMIFSYDVFTATFEHVSLPIVSWVMTFTVNWAYTWTLHGCATPPTLGARTKEINIMIGMNQGQVRHLKSLTEGQSVSVKINLPFVTVFVDDFAISVSFAIQSARAFGGWYALIDRAVPYSIVSTMTSTFCCWVQARKMKVFTGLQT